jgi:hypothetical protein
MGRLIIGAARASCTISRTRSTLGSLSATAHPDLPNLSRGETVACTSNLPLDRGADRRGPSDPITAAFPSTAERLSEIAEILAAGLIRLRARKSSGLLPGEPDFSLGSLAQQSGGVAITEGDTP